MTQLVINLSRATQQVGIIDSKGRKTSFRLMARGRVETDYAIDPNWIAHNRGAVKIVTLTPPVVSTPAAETAPTSTSSESTKAAATKAAAPVATSIASESTPAEGAK
jgi:hypothetical protein